MAAAAAMVAAAASFLAPLFYMDYPTLTRVLRFALWAPAVLLGLRTWLGSRSFLTHPALVGCLGLMAAGLLWVDYTEAFSGSRLLLSVSMAFPIAALIAKEDALEVSILAYALTSVAALIYIFLMDSTWLTLEHNARFGMVLDSNDNQVVNPNEIATQWGFGIVTCAALFAFGNARGERGQSRRSRIALTICAAVLGVGVILTASRGAILATMIGLCFVVIRRLRSAVLLSIAVLALAQSIFLLEERTVFRTAVERFSNEQGVQSAGDRVQIWSHVPDAIFEDARHMLVGAGTGGASKQIARFAGSVSGERGADGVLRVSPHSAYFVWLLSYGMLGVVFGTVLVLVLIRRARGLDRRVGFPIRTSMLAFCSVSAVVISISHIHAWTGIMAIALAFLTPGRIDKRRTHAPRGTRSGVKRTQVGVRKVGVEQASPR